MLLFLAITYCSLYTLNVLLFVVFIFLHVKSSLAIPFRVVIKESERVFLYSPHFWLYHEQCLNYLVQFSFSLYATIHITIIIRGA